ncbi:MAG: serine/threonine protein kinase [Lachnospiraceae bacterium]|nr:serine/threonine protein kinase [Lachnospiraceae bacterium]
MAEIGTVIEGKYEILKLIGKGGMSKVYLAMDNNLNKQWAIKEIVREARDRNNEVIVQSAIAEANMMKKLDHPCLPRIVDIINHDNVIYVVMDYIEGEPLSKILQQDGAQPQEVVLEWAESLCGVLEYLHSQNPPIIYRDMKPANVMLQPNGNIKLIDFGIAREYKEHNLEDTVALGTKGYAAPEQFGGRGQTDARTDIYCLGVTLYHLLTGHNPCDPPYKLNPLREMNPNLSAGLENIIIKCTQLNPADRYDSCAELLYALRHLEESDEGYRKKQKRKIGLFFGMLATSAVFAVSGVVFNFLKNKTNNSNFDNFMIIAKTSVTDEEKVENYEKAIEIKPNSIEPYIGIVDTFKSDASFTIEEENSLKRIINPGLASLRESKGYDKLAYEIGKTYWYYYEYGKTEEDDNQITRMKSSIQWFHDAAQYGDPESVDYRLATTYEQIGLFYKNITVSVNEASDKGMYIEYFNNLSSLMSEMDEEQSEMLKLEVYKLCINSLETYAYKIASDGVSKENEMMMLENIIGIVKKMETTSEKTDAMKTEILERNDFVREAIEKAY